jgi:hypothetical protein
LLTGLFTSTATLNAIWALGARLALSPGLHQLYYGLDYL